MSNNFFSQNGKERDTIPNASFACEFCDNSLEEKSLKKGRERVIISCFSCMLDIPKLHQHGDLKQSVDTADAWKGGGSKLKC